MRSRAFLLLLLLLPLAAAADSSPIGQRPAADSVSVVLASDQPPISIISDGGGVPVTQAPLGPYPSTTSIQLTTTPTLVPPTPVTCPTTIYMLNKDVGGQAPCVPAGPDGGVRGGPGTPTSAVNPAAIADANGSPISTTLPITFCTDRAQAFRQLSCWTDRPQPDGGVQTQPTDGGVLTYWLGL